MEMNDTLSAISWERYVITALEEVEAVKDNQTIWISIEEFWAD